jgi:hypothetical protein
MLEQAHQAVQLRVSELRCSATQDQNKKERRDLDVAAHYLGLLRSLEAQQHWVCLSQSIFSEGLPRGMEFGNVRGYWGLAKANRSTQHRDQGRLEISAANITLSSLLCLLPPSCSQNHGLG